MPTGIPRAAYDTWETSGSPYTPRQMPSPVLPPHVQALATRIQHAFSGRGHELYLVGGVVRDVLLRAPVADDLDFTTSAKTAESRRALGEAGADSLYAVGERFGTIGAMFGQVRVEVTTYRAEAYAPGSRKPSVAFGGRLEDDLARRDFTVNAMALDPSTGVLHDPFRGCDDLQARVIRAVGNARDRFAEDPLRLPRAVRFATRLDFEIEAQTTGALRDTAAALASISRERVRDELNKLLLSPAPARGIWLLCDLGLAPHAVPELLAMRGMNQEAGRYKDVFTHTLQVLDRTPPRLGLRWAALLHDVAKPRTFSLQNGQVHFFGHDRVGEKVARRILTDLHQDSALTERAARLVGLHLRANAYEPDWTDGAVRRFAREVGDDLLEDLLALSRADVTSGRAERRLAVAQAVAELEARISHLRTQADIAKLASPLDGNDLMELFARKPGPWIKPIKDHLLDLVLDGQLGMEDRAAAVPIARQLYAKLERGEG